MKEYVNPKVEIIAIKSTDVITTSLGTETSRCEQTDGIWDLNIA